MLINLNYFELTWIELDLMDRLPHESAWF